MTIISGETSGQRCQLADHLPFRDRRGAYGHVPCRARRATVFPGFDRRYRGRPDCRTGAVVGPSTHPRTQSRRRSPRERHQPLRPVRVLSTGRSTRRQRRSCRSRRRYLHEPPLGTNVARCAARRLQRLGDDDVSPQRVRLLVAGLAVAPYRHDARTRIFRAADALRRRHQHRGHPAALHLDLSRDIRPALDQ